MLIANFALNRATNGVVIDTWGFGHLGICTDTTIVTDPEGRFQQCMSFNGTSSKVSVPDLVCPHTFTIAAWLRKGPFLSFYYAAIVAFGNDMPFFGLNNARLLLASNLTTPNPLDLSWNHVAATQDERGCRIYLNGQQVGSSPSRTPTGGRGMVIGCNLGRSNAWFQGEIASVTLFDEALSEKDLLQLMLSPVVAETAQIPILISETMPPPSAEFTYAPDSVPAHPPPIATTTPAPLLDEDAVAIDIVEIVDKNVRPEVTVGWSFECKLGIDDFEHKFQVFVASVITIDAASFEQEVTFAVEVFGKPLLLPVRHRTPISSVEEYSRIFEEHAFFDFALRAPIAYREQCAKRQWEKFRGKFGYGE